MRAGDLSLREPRARPDAERTRGGREGGGKIGGLMAVDGGQLITGVTLNGRAAGAI